jgi:integrase family protein with SAM-like domain
MRRAQRCSLSSSTQGGSHAHPDPKLSRAGEHSRRRSVRPGPDGRGCVPGPLEGGRTLETYRYDLRTFFQWCSDVGLDVLEAKRAHIELWRSAMEERGLAASTIDRRLSSICGFYRFAHIDGRIASNPAQYARRPKVFPSEGRGLDRGELGGFLFTAERYDPTTPLWRPSWVSTDCG